MNGSDDRVSASLNSAYCMLEAKDVIAQEQGRAGAVRALRVAQRGPRDYGYRSGLPKS